jgi:hypothetical protein
MALSEPKRTISCIEIRYFIKESITKFIAFRAIFDQNFTDE